MNSKNTYLILLVVIVLIVAGVYFVPKLIKPKGAAPSPSPSITATVQAGIDVLLPKANDTIASPLKITGSVSGNGWAGFEGQVGTVTLLDNAGKVLATGILTASGDWMVLPTNFETTLQFTAAAGTPGFLVFKNENASGEPDKDKTYVIPVSFK